MKDIYKQMGNVPDGAGNPGGEGQSNQPVTLNKGTQGESHSAKAVYHKPVLRCLGSLISVAGSDPHW